MALDCLIPVYLPASWKGIPFQVDSSSDKFGRRGEVYEYPLSNQTGYKDLGRKARRFGVEGYLIGGDQIDQTVAMAKAAESAEPGTLVHPAFGRQRVACVQLTTRFDYRTGKRRTKLSFDFVEANDSQAPYSAGIAIPAMMTAGTAAIDASMASSTWFPVSGNRSVATQASLDLATQVAPASTEESFDSISMLERGVATASAPPLGPTSVSRAIAGFAATSSVGPVGSVYMTFPDVIDPIADGTAMVRQLHPDALARLCTFNSNVVDLTVPGNSSVESLIMSSRLSLIRDYALVAMQTTYPTIKAAMDDLDFVVQVYDEEELAAGNRGDDVLTNAIRDARALAVQSILQRNIRLPGLLEFNVDGVWPSLVCAHKLYADGKRYLDVENYNPEQPPYFMGRSTVGPAF